MQKKKYKEICKYEIKTAGVNKSQKEKKRQDYEMRLYNFT